MKKNTMMRIASFLLIAVLLTTSTISGTYAKYVTSDVATATARVAEFGVTVVVSGTELFGKEYASHSAPDYTGVTVSAEDFVVAPGTSSKDVKDTVTFQITGTPEVATKIDIEMTVNHDIFLGAGTYGDPTSTNVKDSFEVAAPGYYPVVFTLTNSDKSWTVSGNLAKIEEEFEKLSASYAPNDELDETYTLTWEWKFESGNDAADTMLGNLASGKGWNIGEVTNYDTVIDYEIKITVTQVD